MPIAFHACNSGKHSVGPIIMYDVCALVAGMYNKRCMDD